MSQTLPSPDDHSVDGLWIKDPSTIKQFIHNEAKYQQNAGEGGPFSNKGSPRRNLSTIQKLRSLRAGLSERLYSYDIICKTVSKEVS